MATPVDTSSFNPQQLAAFNSANALGSGVQTTNTSSQTPASYVNPNASLQVPASSASNIVPPAITTGSPQQTGANAQNMAQQGQLVAPPNGSVVDLLNTAGQDSSFASRQQLAQQFGIQNYTGTAAQNTDLSQKYLDAYNAKKGTQVPQNGGDARSALNESLSTTTDAGSPTQSFYDAYGSMAPVEASLYSQINQILSSPATTQSFSDQYQQLVQAQGIPALQTQLMNVNNIMNGTEDDIRSEITAAGGFATNSQVEALTAARNKTLLTQANSLQSQLQLKQDYVNQIMQFSQADRADVEKQVDQKLGLTTQLSDLEDKMNNAAKSNYQSIVSRIGYSGLAASLKNDPQQQEKAEELLGLGKGSLSDPGFIASSDAGQVLGSAATGYFSYNPFTGETTPIAGGTPPNNYSPTNPTQPTIPTLNGKSLTDAQSTALGYAQRMNDADQLINSLSKVGTSGWQSLLAGIPVVGNLLTSSDKQQLDQAERNFVNAVLRRESGAAISPSEFDSAAQQYFPQPGDSDAVINQKTANRERVIGSLSQSANVPTSYITGSSASSSGSYQDYLKAIGQ